ncbi:MAG TPA: hypothetical protein VE844_19540, partial [Gammaproteobacteria bacterium]|nr:hypothetical protein [Gammaproteobacteria bacterium]
AVPIDYGIRVFHAPAALGGLLVVVLILSPESLAAARAALANQLQRSVNLPPEIGAGDYQPDHTIGADDRLHHGTNRHPRTRHRRYDPAAINADFHEGKSINIFRSRAPHGYWKTTGRFCNQGIF